MPVVRDLECDWNDLGKWEFFFQGKIIQNNTFTTHTRQDFQIIF